MEVEIIAMNEYEIEEAYARYQDHPILGAATRTLMELVKVVNRNSDGWPYWRKPSMAAHRLMEMIGSHRFYDVRTDVTREDLRKAYAPLKKFRTTTGLQFELYEPEIRSEPVLVHRRQESHLHVLEEVLDAGGPLREGLDTDQPIYTPHGGLAMLDKAMEKIRAEMAEKTDNPYVQTIGKMLMAHLEERPEHADALLAENKTILKSLDVMRRYAQNIQVQGVAVVPDEVGHAIVLQFFGCWDGAPIEIPAEPERQVLTVHNAATQTAAPLAPRISTKGKKAGQYAQQMSLF